MYLLDSPTCYFVLIKKNLFEPLGETTLKLMINFKWMVGASCVCLLWIRPSSKFVIDIDYYIDTSELLDLSNRNSKTMSLGEYLKYRKPTSKYDIICFSMITN